MDKKGRLAHGYEIRVERAGQFPTEHHLIFAGNDEVTEIWNEFQQEHVGDASVHGAQIYRSSECKKNVGNRTILGAFSPRQGERWH